VPLGAPPEGEQDVVDGLGIPQEQFVAAWNGSEGLAEVVEKVKAPAGGAVPKWAVMARAVALRKGGVEMKELKADVAALH
jgi:hypothetical protein